MSAPPKVIEDLKRIFQSGVEAVQPKNLFASTNFRLSNEESTISLNFAAGPVTVDIGGNKRCHLVGFGKAVYGMADVLAKVLGGRLASGLISIPLHTMDKFPEIRLPQTIRVYEGARNNLPDQLAATAASAIIHFVRRLSADDILFVLISGGGSALLPQPCNGITLDEKLTIIKALTAKGASIDDLNRVRIDLSGVKGGKLGAMAKDAGTVISFILSDIIGDPLHLIASGPTVQPGEQQDGRCAIHVLQQYGLWPTLSDRVKAIIRQSTAVNEHIRCDNIQNFIIANNEVAVNRMLRTIADDRHQIGLILSTRIQGNVTEIARAYCELSRSVERLRHQHIGEGEFLESVEALRDALSIRPSFMANIVAAVQEARHVASDLYVIAGGEPTVEVVGQGLGGRNQELALQFGSLCAQDALLNDVLLLSAGTDGIDGEIMWITCEGCGKAFQADIVSPTLRKFFSRSTIFLHPSSCVLFHFLSYSSPSTLQSLSLYLYHCSPVIFISLFYLRHPLDNKHKRISEFMSVIVSSIALDSAQARADQSRNFSRFPDLGPTAAAGAIGGARIIQNYLQHSGAATNTVDTFISNNDSYGFYSDPINSEFHLVTGHTGTNVMDLHLLYFKQ